ncbi:MAG: hypothetical protein JWO80_1360 [Bryobacterales bacterium]|nr:hypothetical protein [Bryobacterales bacterium]
MRDPGPEMPDSHPAIDVLLRYEEDDLSTKEQRLVAAHLGHCWTCQVQIEEIRAGIRGFMKFREEVLLPSCPIDPRAGAVRDRVVRKAREDSSPSRPKSIFPVARIGPEKQFRPAWIAASLSLAATCAFFFLAGTEPRLMAGEFLDHVESSLAIHREQERGRVVHQRVNIRRGASSVERVVVRGPARTKEGVARDEPAWMRTLSGPLTWEDPLDAGSFVQWRALQRVRHEDVTASSGLLTLTVANGETQPGVIRKVSLVVRRSDWHIVAKRVEWQSEPDLEATEIGYDIHDEASADSLPAAGLSAKNRHDLSHYPIAGDAAPEPDLDATEIHVRSVLFHLGFGFGGEEIAPSVHRIKNAIVVRGVISSAERRTQLGSALDAIPNAIDRVADSVTLPPAGKMSEVAGVQSSARIRPPRLRELLIERFGNEKSATDFSNDTLADSGKILALAVQYRELAMRYARAEADALPPECRRQLSALVQDVEHEIQLNLQGESRRLRPITGEITGPELNSAMAWQDRAEQLFRLALMHDRIVSLLFAVTGTDDPELEDSASDLDRLRRVSREIMSLVSP